MKYLERTLFLVTILLLSSSFSLRAQYPYKWSVGGTMGFGVTVGKSLPGFTMSATVGFNKAVKETKWRWGIDAGIMNQGVADYYFDEDDPDRFIRPNFEYIGGVVDYSIFSKNAFTLFARGGVAPAHRRDLYIRHFEDKYTCLGLLGIGTDYYWGRWIINGYVDPQGYCVLMLSFGLCFGKTMNPWW